MLEPNVKGKHVPPERTPGSPVPSCWQLDLSAKIWVELIQEQDAMVKDNETLRVSSNKQNEIGRMWRHLQTFGRGVCVRIVGR